jgi:thiamine kinase-like enzyme
VKVAPKPPPPEADTADAPPTAAAGSCCCGARRRRRGARPRPAAVAVKVFGEKTELLIDREAEAKAVVALGAAGFGPKVSARQAARAASPLAPAHDGSLAAARLGAAAGSAPQAPPPSARPRAAPRRASQVLALFGNGRIEQFLHCLTLTPQQMCAPAFIPRIAALLARFHATRVPLPRVPGLFPTIRRWLEMARALEFPAAAAGKAAAHAALDFGALAGEVAAVEAACLAARSPVVWGHNDLLSGNLLVLQEPGFDPEAPDLGGPLTVIDFEYGAYTYRGFDWGNHFNEYAGFECDYSRWASGARAAAARGKGGGVRAHWGWGGEGQGPGERALSAGGARPASVRGPQPRRSRAQL